MYTKSKLDKMKRLKRKMEEDRAAAKDIEKPLVPEGGIEEEKEDVPKPAKEQKPLNKKKRVNDSNAKGKGNNEMDEEDALEKNFEKMDLNDEEEKYNFEDDFEDEYGNPITLPDILPLLVHATSIEPVSFCSLLAIHLLFL